MKKILILIFGFLINLTCIAQPILIEENLDRMQGIFTKSPVYIRALGWMPEEKTDTAILYFNGWPSISRIENDASDIRLSTLMRIIQDGLGGQLKLSVQL